jgi:hypothetical protein
LSTKLYKTKFVYNFFWNKFVYNNTLNFVIHFCLLYYYVKYLHFADQTNLFAEKYILIKYLKNTTFFFIFFFFEFYERDPIIVSKILSPHKSFSSSSCLHDCIDHRFLSMHHLGIFYSFLGQFIYSVTIYLLYIIFFWCRY